MCPIKVYTYQLYNIRSSSSIIHVSHWQRVVVRAISLSCKTGKKGNTATQFYLSSSFPPFTPQKRLPPSLSSCHWTMYGSWASTIEAKVVILGSQGNSTNTDIVAFPTCNGWNGLPCLGVGKTSLVVRYISKTFSPNSTSTIGASFMTKKL